MKLRLVRALIKSVQGAFVAWPTRRRFLYKNKNLVSPARKCTKQQVDHRCRSVCSAKKECPFVRASNDDHLEATWFL